MNIKEMDPVIVVSAGTIAVTLILAIGVAIGRTSEHQYLLRTNVQIHILRQTKTTRQTEILPRGGATRVRIVKCLPGAARGAICVRARYPKALPLARQLPVAHPYIPLDQHKG